MRYCRQEQGECRVAEEANICLFRRALLHAAVWYVRGRVLIVLSTGWNCEEVESSATNARCCLTVRDTGHSNHFLFIIFK